MSDWLSPNPPDHRYEACNKVTKGFTYRKTFSLRPACCATQGSSVDLRFSQNVGFKRQFKKWWNRDSRKKPYKTVFIYRLP